MKIVLLILLLVLAALLALAPTLSAQTLLHDVSADSILAPNSLQSLGSPTTPILRITNRGLSDEINVITAFTISDQYHNIVFRDTAIISLLKSGQTINRSFPGFTPLSLGTIYCCGVVALSTDQNPANDMICDSTIVKYDRDLEAVSILAPAPGVSLPVGSSFTPKASFRNLGAVDQYNVKVRFEIRRCIDDLLASGVDTLIEAFSADSTVSVQFPSIRKGYDTKYIPPGCYRTAAIVKLGGDYDLMNDTAYSNLTIYIDHDVSADSVLNLPNNALPGVPIPMVVRYTNRGRNDESTFKVILTAIGYGQSQYRDSNYISCKSGKSIDVRFRDFTPTEFVPYFVCSTAQLAGDMDTTNNSTCSSFTIKVLHDMSVGPLQLSDRRLAVGFSEHVGVGYQNYGASDESAIPVILSVTNPQGNIVYRDTAYTQSCKSSQWGEVAFRDFTAADKGVYNFCAVILLPGDQYTGNDTMCTSVESANASDIDAFSVYLLDEGDTVTEGTSFQSIGEFRNLGARDLFSPWAHIEIRRCNDSQVLIRLDNQPYVIYAESSYVVADTFPSRQGIYDTKNLLPGCYQIAAFTDIGNPPDTAFSYFYIIGRPQQANVNIARQGLSARISPNPSTGIANLFLTLPTDAPVSIEINNILGERVTSIKYDGILAGEIVQPLDLSALPNGSYQIRIVAGSKFLLTPIAIIR